MGSEKIKIFFNRVPYLLLVGIYLLYLGWDYYEFISKGVDSPLYSKTQELESLELQVIKLEKRSEQAKKFFENFEKKKIELRSLAQGLNGLKVTLSEELDVPAFIKTVVTEAKRVGLKVRSLAPLKEVRKPLYIERQFKFNFTGAYVQIIVFLEHLSKVQKIIQIGTIKLSPRGSQSAQYVQLNGEMNLKVYRYAGSKADEIAKDVEAGDS